MPYTFSRDERIKSQKLSHSLFTGGNSRSMAVYPVRMVYMPIDRAEGDAPVKTMMSVSKRHFKRAVKRNRVKRQLREAYRLNKHILHDAIVASGCGKAYALTFIWQSDELYESSVVEESMVNLLMRLAEKISKIYSEQNTSQQPKQISGHESEQISGHESEQD